MARAPDAELLRLIIGHVCLQAAMMGARMAAPLLALSEGYSKSAAGVLVALFAAMQIVLSLPAGRYTDRRGLKRPLAWCVVATSGSIGAAAAWPNFPVLCGTALVSGAAAGAAVIALQRHLGRTATSAEHRMHVFAWLSIAPAAANFVGPIATGLAIDRLGFRGAFLMLAFLPVLAWVLARPVRDLPALPVAAGPMGGAVELLRDPRTRRVLVMNALMSSSWDLHSFMVPVLGFDRGIDAAGIGFVLGMFALAATGIRFAMAAVAARIPEWRMLTVGIGMAGLVLLAYPLTGSIAGMAFCSVLLGMALGSVQPVVLALLHDCTPAHRVGEALALRLISVNVTALAMPLLLGVTAGAVGAAAVFWGMGALVAVGSRVGVGLRPGR